jgi:hypothetical protein
MPNLACMNLGNAFQVSTLLNAFYKALAHSVALFRETWLHMC